MMVKEFGIIALVAAVLLPQIAISQSNSAFYPMRSDWPSSDSKVNISSFVFHDLNANGVYDLDDRSFADIAVALGFNGAARAAARTNLNGFANFQASTSIETAPLSTPGQYEFYVLTPPGWFVSTNNTRQIRDLVAIEGSPAGVGFTDMLTPVGLVRYKFIRGTYGGNTRGALTLMQGDTLITTAVLEPGEEYLWPVDPGEYSLISRDMSRSVTVNNYPVDVGTIDQITPFETGKRTIDFENTAPTGLRKVPNGYGGLNWVNLNIQSAHAGGNSIGYANGTTSGNYHIYTSSGHPAEISADQVFDFISVNLSVAWPDAEGELVVFEFYRGDTLIMTEEIGLSTYGPISYQPHMQDITRMRISSKHYWQVVLDDLVVNTAE